MVTDEGEATVEVQDASRVTPDSVRLRASNRLCGVLVADALAVSLGPLLARVDGVELEVDGTTPKAQLERELWSRQMERLKKLEHDLDNPRRH